MSAPDLLPPLTASIAIVADRDRFKRERDELYDALHWLVGDCYETDVDGSESLATAKSLLIKVRR